MFYRVAYLFFFGFVVLLVVFGSGLFAWVLVPTGWMQIRRGGYGDPFIWGLLCAGIFLYSLKPLWLWSLEIKEVCIDYGRLRRMRKDY